MICPGIICTPIGKVNLAGCSDTYLCLRVYPSILILNKDKEDVNLGVRGVRGMEGRKAGKGCVMQFQLKTFSKNYVKSCITMQWRSLKEKDKFLDAQAEIYSLKAEEVKFLPA